MKNIVIIGSGVVGTATGKGFIAHGHSVVFHDIKDERLNDLKRQSLNARHMDALDANGVDAFFFAVSTPTENGRINLQHLRSAVKSVGKKLRNREGYFMIVIRSTVPPGTTRDMLIPLIEKTSDKEAGRDFGVAMNPEYLREKSAEEDFMNPWAATVGSLDQRSQRFMDEILSEYPCQVRHLSLREAEMQKYVHNLYNAVKIAFFNEMRMVCEEVGIVPDEIFDITTESAEGFWNKRYGTRNLGPFDGACLPKDTEAFLHWSKKLRFRMDVLDGAIESNKRFKEIWEKRKAIEE